MASNRRNSGMKGVRWHQGKRKWYAHIRINGARIHLGYFDSLEHAIAARRRGEREQAERKAHDRKTLTAQERQAFYSSRAWKSRRMDILERDGGRCVCCGVTRMDGARLHVDHIKPLSIRPDLRLEPNNLQTLCEDCNLGKGNRYATNWRGQHGKGEPLRRGQG